MRSHECRMFEHYKKAKLGLKKEYLMAIQLYTPPLPNPIGRRPFGARFEGRKRRSQEKHQEARRCGSDELHHNPIVDE